MDIPLWSIIVALVFAALILWANQTLVTDAMIQKVIRVLVVVVFVLYILGLVVGVGPRISFR